MGVRSHNMLNWLNCTVKLGEKKRFDKEQIGVKVRIFWEKTIFVEFLTSTLLLAQNTTLLSKVRPRFFQILWPSQKTQTLRNHCQWPIANLLHKDKEHLALRSNIRVTKKLLITEFDCSCKLMASFRTYLASFLKAFGQLSNLACKKCQFTKLLKLP